MNNSQAPDEFVLINARIVQDSSAVLDNGFVYIKDSKIKAVGSAWSQHQAALEIKPNIVDLDGMTLLPGFIDAHVHSCWSGEANLPAALNGKGEGYIAAVILNNMRKTLEAGFMWVRDLGCPGKVSFDVRDVLRSKLFSGAQMVCAGPPLTMTGGHTWFISKEVDGVDEIRKAVRQSMKDGADCIKLIATGGVLSPGMEPGSEQLGEEEMRVAVQEAHKKSKQVTVHAIGATGIVNALKAGVDSIEHGVYLTNEAIELMLERDVILVPTLTAVDTMVRHGKEGGLPQYSIDKANKVYDHHRASIEKALDAGVKVAFGTDAGTPFNLHGENRQEFKLLSELGMDAGQCIASATTIAAQCISKSESVGALREGMDANIIGYYDNPLDDITVLDKVPELVIFEGQQIRLGAVT